MMKRILMICLFSASLIIVSKVNAMDVAGIIMPEKYETGNQSLQLNGTGIRKKFFTAVYVAGLYVEQRSNNAIQIIDSDKSMAIRIHIISKLVTSKRMEAATREGFNKSLSGNIDIYRIEIEEFIAVFKEEIRINDVYDLVYLKKIGLQIFKNGDLKKTIPGIGFKKALFGIWLGSNPIQEKLKKDLLGN